RRAPRLEGRPRGAVRRLADRLGDRRRGARDRAVARERAYRRGRTRDHTPGRGRSRRWRRGRCLAIAHAHGAAVRALPRDGSGVLSLRGALDPAVLPLPWRVSAAPRSAIVEAVGGQTAEQIIAGVVLSERLAVTMYGAIHRAQ